MEARFPLWTRIVGATMNSHYAVPWLLAGLACQAACAAPPLYKWLDAAGQVTYSSLPPPAGTPIEKLQSPPQPTPEQIRDAEERLKRTQALAGEMEARRRQQEAQAAEEAWLRAMQSPPAPIVIEQPVYVPQPVYYPPVMKPPKRHPGKPPPRPRSDRRQRAPFD